MGEISPERAAQGGPAVSVVVPLYNARDTIGSCLESVLRQSFQDFEIVVVDDGSTDGGGDVARQVGDARIRVFSQPNGGVSRARNRGIAESRGELVALVDADDEWEPDYLETIQRLASRYPEAGLCATGLRRLSADGSAVEIFASLPEETGMVERYFSAPQEGFLLAPSCAAIRRSVLKEVGGFAEGEPRGEDLDLWCRIALAYPIACTRRVLATYHVDEDGARAARRLNVERPASPIHVRTLRRMLAAGRVPARMVGEVRRYSDYHAMSSLHCLLELNVPTAKEQVLGERFYTLGFRLEAAALRAAVRVLPPRLVWRLRSGPGALIAKLFGPRIEQTGRLITRRKIPAPRSR